MNKYVKKQAGARCGMNRYIVIFKMIHLESNCDSAYILSMHQ